MNSCAIARSFVLLQTELEISRLGVSTEPGRRECHDREAEEVFMGGEGQDSPEAFGGQGAVPACWASARVRPGNQ